MDDNLRPVILCRFIPAISLPDYCRNKRTGKIITNAIYIYIYI